MDNAKALENGFAKGLEIIQDTLVGSLIKSIQQLFTELPRKKGFSGFTGQTQTSYMGGVYVNGHLRYIVTQSAWTKLPVRGKVPRGKSVHLKSPYEGPERTIHGEADIGEPSGRLTSLHFLQGFDAPRHGLTVVITTGTEYSEFIEDVLELDVLTRTFRDAPKVLNNNWRKIP